MPSTEHFTLIVLLFRWNEFSLRGCLVLLNTPMCCLKHENQLKFSGVKTSQPRFSMTPFFKYSAQHKLDCFTLHPSNGPVANLKLQSFQNSTGGFHSQWFKPESFGVVLWLMVWSKSGVQLTSWGRLVGWSLPSIYDGFYTESYRWLVQDFWNINSTCSFSKNVPIQSIKFKVSFANGVYLPEKPSYVLCFSSVRKSKFESKQMIMGYRFTSTKI